MGKLFDSIKKLGKSAKGRTLLLAWSMGIIFFGQLGIIGPLLTNPENSKLKLLILNIKLVVSMYLLSPV
jgi:hypothetical protein